MKISTSDIQDLNGIWLIIKNKGENMIGKILDALYPRACPICEKTISNNKDICEECESTIKVISNPKCEKCGKQLHDDGQLYCEDCIKTERSFDKGISVFPYKDKMKESIYSFKYENKRENVHFYGRKAIEIYEEQIRKWNIDAIVPVPVSISKEVKRGYNQALVFAKEISKLTGIPIVTKLLIRKKETNPQKLLGNEMRYYNMKNVFAIDRKRIGGISNVLLVDDIFTTGSTADACGRILKKAGVKHVYVLCIGSGDC